MEQNNTEIKKTTILKKLFLISLVPHIIFFTLGIGNSVYNIIVNNHSILGALAYDLKEPGHDVLNILCNNGILIQTISMPFIIFFIMYPIYYLIYKLVTKKSNILSFILFVISFIPYWVLSFVCITEISTFSRESYGLGTVFSFLIIGTIIPIYPIILLYQIIFFKKKYKTLNINMKKFIKVLIALTILSILIPSIILYIKELQNYHYYIPVNNIKYIKW